MTSNNVLEDKLLRMLRENKVITEQEVALLEGDIFVAKNVLTEKKRILDSSLLKKYKIKAINENTNKKLHKD